MSELENIARREGRPTSHLIREAMEGYVAEHQPGSRRLPAFVGIGAGPGDVAEHAEEILEREFADAVAEDSQTDE